MSENAGGPGSHGDLPSPGSPSDPFPLGSHGDPFPLGSHSDPFPLGSHSDPLLGLYSAVVAVGEELELLPTLQRVVDEARRLVDARFGALGVWNADQLVAFLHSGLSPDEASQIAGWPTGVGLLGHLARHPTSMRLEALGEHPMAAGFPLGHPPMERFLGCPIEVGGVIVGTLYLAEPRVNPTFTESDEHTLALYAAAAGTAINNARRFDALARRESLLAGLHAINAAALAPAGAVADTLVRVATRLWQARGATLHDAHADSTNTAPAPLAHHGEAAEPDSTELRIAIEAPHGYWELRVWGAAATPSPAEVAQLRAHAALALDFVAHERTFAAAALTAERERLAADLHDRVIQRVFAVGLELQRVAAGPVGREVTEAITFAIDALDSVVVDLRQAIFELHHGVLRPVVSAIQHEVSVAHTPETLAVSDVYDVADEAEAPDDVVDALVLVTREALANVVRHAHTDVASLSLRLDGTTWILTISDCGCGIPDGVTRRSGISNMRRRVARAGGTLSVRANEPSGTVVSVVIPGATERRAP